MHPVLFRLDGLTIYSYGAAMALAFVAGLLNWIWLGKREGMGANFSGDLLFVIMLSGIVGARLAYVALDAGYFLANPLEILMLNKGGLVFYGGFIGGLAGVLVFSARKRRKALATLDFVATSLPLAHSIGRIGCFLNGCCHGSVCSCSLGVSFPSGSPAWWEQFNADSISEIAHRSLPVHPTQLYEAVLNLALYFVVVKLYKTRNADGTVTAVYLLGYSAGRFMLEYLRGDTRSGMLDLSLGQVISAALFAAGLVLLVWARRRKDA